MILSEGFSKLPLFFLPLILSVLGMHIGIKQTSFKHICSYLAEEGIAEFTYKNNRRCLDKKCFSFNHVESLFVNDSYDYTNKKLLDAGYVYQWKDKYNNLIYEIKGKYTLKNSNLSEQSCLAIAAEKHWTDYKFSKVADNLHKGGTVNFGIKGVTIEMGIRTMNIFDKDMRLIWGANDIDSIKIFDGKVVIYHSNYKDYGVLKKIFSRNESTISFRYSDIPNALLFLKIYKMS